jgi:ABC-type transporter Mla subunit MlaD
VSLGPPFDDSGESLQRVVGAVSVACLLALIAGLMLAAGHTVGAGVLITVAQRRAGPLHPGCKVRVAGREAGEIRAVVTRALPDGGRGVALSVFIARDHASEVRRNSRLFVDTPSVLGEAFLEIGPPASGEAPGPPIADGDVLAGSEPPEIDKLLEHLEAALRQILALWRDDGGALDELGAASDRLIATLSGLPGDRGQLRRVVDQAARALAAGELLARTLREAGGAERIARAARELYRVAEEAQPELTALGARVDRALEQLDAGSQLFGPERRRAAAAALERLDRTIGVAERLAADLRWLGRRVAAGEGTIGALLADRELFDDLHEAHRIIKAQPLKVLLKPAKE